MKNILIATHNSGKQEELLLGLAPLRERGVKFQTVTDLKISSEPEETGKTFRENALLKAKFYSNLTGLPTIADDGGIVIPFLNNEPGVKSRRWLGYDASDEELINHTLLRLKAADKSQRNAYLEVCICFYNPVTKTAIFEEEKINGQIAYEVYKKFAPGFPYRGLLIVNKYHKYYDELSPAEHQKDNHRLKALKRLVKKINDLIE